MIKRTKKICETCKLPKYIFSKGNCITCANIGYTKKSYTKKKKVNTATLEKDWDRIYSQVKRLEACNKNGYLSCYICGDTVYWKYAQLMHFISRGVKILRFNDINCHPGCHTCNVTKRGNLELYELRLKEEYGDSVIEYLENEKAKRNRYSSVKMIEEVKRLEMKKKLLIQKLYH